MSAQPRIRFGTNIITFFHPPHWGLPADLSHPEWVAAFDADPRRYFEAMFDGVRDAGLEGVELAPDPGGWERALAAFGGTRQLADALEERGLVLTSSYAHGRQLIGNAIEHPDLVPVADDAFRRHAEFLAEMGADTIVTGNLARSRFGNNSPDETATAADYAAPVPRDLHERFADHLNRLGAITGELGVRIAIHTDAFSVCSRNADIATVLSLTDPATVQLCPDAGHITLDGGDAVAVLRDHIDRIPTMHWKDCHEPLLPHTLRGDQKERHAVMLTYFRVLGSGRVDWHEWMRILRDHGWSGWATEEIDMSPDPVGELRQGLEYFQRALAPIYR
ncbi:sugar phosphate isomerase/epimerase family protein [Georgenia thermotolerans]|uniref:TIM barrel protein n=1 Tax=Georgenia thermotolerans TaxID=527326 RepID=A0A7J5UUF8_9MICO|nr:sugar phosphate isomerase/epimerase [Georgenia thermotolerans]KAE8765929.1 TIM barrel protein [Georgenia thermotolerans]